MITLLTAQAAAAQTADAQAATPAAPQGASTTDTTQPTTPATQPSAGTTTGGSSSTSGSTDIEASAQPADSTVTKGDLARPNADAATGGEIVVTGIRQSLANAQSIKRNSDTVVDAITAEDIGALPDRSVNEAIQRVPGVAISRFAAPNDSQHFSVEGSGVVIRGLSYVQGEFNGRDTFATSQGRQIGFNDVPSELVGSVEVFKNLTADMIEGGISGSVNINTRKPFDSPGQTIFLSAQGNIGDLERRLGPSVVGLYSKQWTLGDGSRFGILASGTYSQQFSRSNSVFVGAVLPRYNDDTNGNGVQDNGEGRVINAGTPYASTVWDDFPVPAGLDHVWTPLGAGSREQDFNRKRKGLVASAQFENASRSLLVTGQFERFDSSEDWIEHTVEPNIYYSDETASFPAGYLSNGFYPYDPNANYTYDKNGVFKSGTITHTGTEPFSNGQSCVVPNPPGSGNSYVGSYCPDSQFIGGGQFTTLSNRNLYTRSVTQDAALNVKWEPTSRLHVNIDGQYVTSKLHGIDDDVDLGTFSNVNLDLSGKVPQITLVLPPLATDYDPSSAGYGTTKVPSQLGSAADYFGRQNTTFIRDAQNNLQDNTGHEWAFRADGQYDLSTSGFLRNLRFGARYADRKQTVRSDNYSNWGSVSDVWSPNGPTTMAEEPADLFTFDHFYSGAVTPPSTWSIPNHILSDHDALENYLRDATKKSGGSYTPLEDRNGGNLIDGVYLPSEIYRNSERTEAAYARLDFGVDHLFGGNGSLSGNIGVRYVETRDIAAGAITFPTSTQVFTPDDPNFPGDPNANPPVPPGPRYTTIPQYCAYSAAHNTSGTIPIICTIPDAAAESALQFANGASVPDNGRQTFHNWLPALNLKLQFSPKLLMRFAASEAISRPDFGQLQDYVGIGSSGQINNGQYGFTARTQNPFLKPVRAKQFDLTAEWYFAKVGSLTGAVFYKRLTDIIDPNGQYTRQFTNNGQTFDVLVNGPVNLAGSGNVKGFEIAHQQTYDFLPGFLKGFGSQETFTYVKAGHIPNAAPDFRSGSGDGYQPPLDVTGLYSNLPLAGLSKYNFNVAGFYDRGGFYARVAYSWRSKFLLTDRDCCFPYLPVFSLASGQMDASAFYNINAAIKVGIEAQNLLSSTDKTVYLLDKDGLTAPRGYFKSDRQFSFIIRSKF